jgi:cell volume regulation protein A
VVAVLEIESGLNDPMSVFLTLLLVQLLLQPGTVTPPEMALHFVREMLGGALLGAACGWALLWIVRRLRADPSLHSVLCLAGGLAVFGAGQSFETSGFLAVYVAGVVVGTGAGALAPAIERAYEAFAWIAQIGLFLMLGLLINPHEVVPLLAPAACMAAVLIVLARPVGVVLCLKPFRCSWSEIGFVGWVGLRGAVPIYLAMIPVLQGVPLGELGFVLAFAIVVLSLAVQGWTIGPMARLLGFTPRRAVTPT